MDNLIKAYNSYSYCEKQPLFVAFYNKIPSNLVTNIFLEESKENMEKVLEIFDTKDLVVVAKNWKTKDDQDAKLNEDYVYEYLFKGKSKQILVEIRLYNTLLEVEFYYDCEDKELENWVLNSNHKLRTLLSEKTKPTFRVLIKKKEEFETKKVKTEDIVLDIEKNYNDDFIEVDHTIQDALQEEKSGLVLLHGLPGTGKTTYIKSLISNYKKTKFIFIQNEFVNELFNPNFISFLIENKNAVLIIEDAEKVIMKRQQTGENSVVSTILQLTDGLFSDYLNIKIICTFNSNLNTIDEALLRKGRMIAYYNFKKLTLDKTNKLLAETSSGATMEELTLAEIYNIDKNNYRQEQKRKIGFN
ncbi:AAA family ATPase [Aureivirga sp. CE67]|uniref:AAA family ATPase n=1 Tax=Aureivirga sp. CE67 TaxID=1788983 RepID=UPI0018CA8B5B|nr:AAA family ATPase [Aureivirga sp. CE67]